MLSLKSNPEKSNIFPSKFGVQEVLFYSLSFFPLLDYGISAILLYTFLIFNAFINKVKIEELWLFTLFFIYLFLIGLMYSGFNPTFKELSHSISIVTIPIFASSFNLSKKKIRTFAFLYLVATLIKAMICIGLLFYDRSFIGGGTIPLISVDFHATYFSYELIMAMILVDYLTKKKSKIIVLILLSFAIVIFQKKIAILALLLFWIFHLFKNKKEWMGLLFIPICIVIFYIEEEVFGKLLQTANNYLSLSLDGTDKVRLKLLEAGWANFKENPLFGKGIVQHDIFFSQYNISNLGPWAAEYDPHNYFLLIACSGGLLGLILFLFPFIYFSIKSYQITKPLLYFLVLTLLFNITESLLLRYQGALTFSIFCFLFYKIHLSRKLEEQEKRT